MNVNHSELHARDRELLPLTDSLSSRVRWRVCDYEAIFKAEINLMLSGVGPGADDDRGIRAAGTEPHDAR